MNVFMSGHWVVPSGGRYAGRAGLVTIVWRHPAPEINHIVGQPSDPHEYTVDFDHIPGAPAKSPVAIRLKFTPEELRLATFEEITEAVTRYPSDG